MPAAKIAVSLDPDDVKEMDRLVKQGLFPSRSRVIQDALGEKLRRMRRVRLAEECAKLDKAEEQAAAEEILRAEAAWPEY